MIKDFFISFSRVIIVQDFETVTFHVLFSVELKVCAFQKIFILCISTAKPISLVRGYIEVKSKHDIWEALTKLTLRCVK